MENFLIGDYTLGREKRRMFALACLGFAVVIACLSYRTGAWLGPDEVNFRPNLVSGLFALFLITPLYVRNIVPWTGINAYSVLSLVLNWAIVGSAANMALEGSSLFRLLGGEMPMSFLLVLAIAFGWLGMRPVAVLAWAAFLLLGTINLAFASNTMGLWGFVFLVSSFLGVLLQADLKPAQLRSGLQVEFFGSQGLAYKDPAQQRLELAPRTSD